MKKILLLLIIILGASLRFSKLTTVPPSLSHDETAIAYNAYSILKTGNDEYDKPFPLLFRSFDDYKLPGMVYATVPSVALFGKSEMGARSPSAFLGTLTILMVYLTILELTRGHRSGISFALASAFFLAISPWHINFSRQLFESNGALFVLSTGVYFLLRSNRNMRFLPLAALIFGLSLYFYYSVRLVIPPIFLAYWLVQKKFLASHKRAVILSLVIFTLTAAPIGSQMLTKGGLERVSIVSLVNDPTYHDWKGTFVRIRGTKPLLVTKVLFNQKTAMIAAAAHNYWKNIAPLHVFSSGTSGYGLQHPIEIPLIIIGAIVFFEMNVPLKWVLLVWFLSSYIPGAISTNQPNALRTLLASPFLSILSGLGAVALYQSLEPKRRFLFAVVPFGLLLWYTLFTFSHVYFTDNPVKNALSFGDGYKQMVTYVKANEFKYDRVVISGFYWRPYVFMLYWGDTDPAEYQRGGTRSSFGKYRFTGAEWDKGDILLLNDAYNPHELVLTTPEKTLFLLAKPEYERNNAKYTYVASIQGRLSPDVFIAALAK